MTQQGERFLNTAIEHGYKYLLVLCIGIIGFFLRDNYEKLVTGQDALLNGQTEILNKMKEDEIKLENHEVRIDFLEKK